METAEPVLRGAKTDTLKKVASVLSGAASPVPRQYGKTKRTENVPCTEAMKRALCFLFSCSCSTCGLFSSLVAQSTYGIGRLSSNLSTGQRGRCCRIPVHLVLVMDASREGHASYKNICFFVPWRSVYDRLYTLLRSVYDRHCCTLFFFHYSSFFFHTHLLPSFSTSRGHRCRPFSPPFLVFNFYRA